jgi:uncharacterized protein (DUF362 family)
MKSVAVDFEHLLSLDANAQAVHTVGLDYSGTVESLAPLMTHDWDWLARVSIVRCADYSDNYLESAVRRTIELLGAEDRLCAARRIVIKVGLIEGRLPDEHVTCHPRLVRALLVVLKKMIRCGTTICVAEGTGHDRDAEWVLARTGLGSVLREQRVPFINLNEDDVRRVEVTEPAALTEFMLPLTVIDSDFVVSLAKMKTHHRAAVTLGMKNLFGCVPGSIYGFPKTKLHYTGTARAIADLAGMIMPNLTILDAVVAMEGTGPLDGRPRAVGALVAGENVATTDIIVARMMGFAPILIPQFWYATSKGIVGKPELVGEPPELFSGRFEAPSNIAWIEGSGDLSSDRQLEILNKLLARDKP